MWATRSKGCYCSNRTRGVFFNRQVKYEPMYTKILLLALQQRGLNAAKDCSEFRIFEAGKKGIRLPPRLLTGSHF